MLVWVDGLGEPLDEDVDIVVSERIRERTDNGGVDTPKGSDVPEGSPWSAIDVGGVVVPLVMEGLGVAMAGLEAFGSEPGSSAKSKRITTMAETDVIPIPFCRRRIFIRLLS